MTIASDQPWITKFRPTSLDGIIGQEKVVRTLNNFIKAGMLPHLMFYGPPGTGKTSTANALARTIYGQQYNQKLLELNASDDRGIDTVRTQIKTFAQIGSVVPTQVTHEPMGDDNPNNCLQVPKSISGLKLIILDEVDHMTSAAQMAMRRIMERYSGHVRFCLICNDVSLVTPAIQSRCTRFRFTPLPIPIIREKLQSVAKSEGIEIDDSGMDVLASVVCQGDFRKGLNALQYGSLQSKQISTDMLLINADYATQAQIDDCFRILRMYKFKDAYVALTHIIRDSRLCLQNLIESLYKECLKIDWPNSAALILYPRIADVMLRLKQGVDETIIVAALVGAFIETRSHIDSIGVQ